MHSAIVVVGMPKESYAARQSWAGFVAAIQKLPADGAARLGENVWLVDFQKVPQALALLVHAAGQFEFPYGILPLAEKPRWSPDGFDPSTIEVQTA